MGPNRLEFYIVLGWKHSSLMVPFVGGINKPIIFLELFAVMLGAEVPYPESC
jgi:hypothetical protein